MVEILRMCSFTLSNPDTVTGPSSQTLPKQALSFRRRKSSRGRFPCFWRILRKIGNVLARPVTLVRGRRRTRRREVVREFYEVRLADRQSRPPCGPPPFGRHPP